MAAVPSSPAYREWRADRWDGYDIEFGIVGVDLSTINTATMEVRAYRDAPGAALIALSMLAPPAQGLSIRTTTTGGVVTSFIRTIINETTIETLLPYPSNGMEPGAEVELVGCIKLSGTGFKKTRWFEGPFIIVPGANQA